MQWDARWRDPSALPAKSTIIIAQRDPQIQSSCMIESMCYNIYKCRTTTVSSSRLLHCAEHVALLHNLMQLRSALERLGNDYMRAYRVAG